MPFHFQVEKLTPEEITLFDSTTAKKLEAAGFSSTAIAAIKEYSPLASSLQEFLARGGKVEKNVKIDATYYEKMSFL